jgi:N-acetylneuraminic acid mutarotase
MHGPSIGSQVGIYGTLGVPNPINNPGARWETSAAWTDSSNNLWLFGGYEINQGVFNDLWRYNIATNMWTWMKGSQFNGQLGIYGIKGIESSDNTPGGRQAYGRWKDNAGNLWLFGGLNYGILYNDLWRYNPNTNNWAWIAGDSSSNTNSVYGRKCLPSSTNKPGARFENRVSVVDSNGNFWMFGGTNDNSFSQVWNDLWSYKVTANQWIWMSGDSIANPIGNWGTIGLSMPTNKPNGRAGAVGWDDNNGHLYLFGGSTTSINGSYNDLWKYSIDTTCFYTNINELNLNEQLINVYPNPTNGDLIIVIHKNFQKVEFTLINRLGEKVFSSIESNIILGFTKNISINNLSKGIYFLEVNMDGKRVMRKVVKE